MYKLLFSLPRERALYILNTSYLHQEGEVRGILLYYMILVVLA